MSAPDADRSAADERREEIARELDRLVHEPWRLMKITEFVLARERAAVAAERAVHDEIMNEIMAQLVEIDARLGNLLEHFPAAHSPESA